MATQEDVDRISSLAEGTEDVAQLRQYRQELLAIAANMAQVIAQTTDTGVQEHAQSIKDSAEYAAQDIGARATQLEIDQMDPDYERRRAERAQFEEQEKQRQAREAQEGLKQLQGLFGGAGGGGLGGMLGGLFGGKQQQAEGAPAEAPPAAEAPAPAGSGSQSAPAAPAAAPQPAGSPTAPGTTQCRGCGQAIQGSPKFCPNCGTPTKNACGSCGQELQGTPKFCPNCGAPTAA